MEIVHRGRREAGALLMPPLKVIAATAIPNVAVATFAWFFTGLFIN
jgi:hypothetical protein